MFRPQEKPSQSDDFIDLEAAMPLIKKPAPSTVMSKVMTSAGKSPTTSTSTSTAGSMLELFPDEVLLAIMQHLPAKDIRELAKTCRRFHNLSIECLRSNEPKFRLYRISLFQKKQAALNDDIEDKEERKHGSLSVTLNTVVGFIMAGISSYVAYKEATTTRSPSRDEKILVGLFLLISIAILLAGLGRAMHNCFLSRGAEQDSRQIGALQEKITQEFAGIRQHRT